MAAAGCSHDRSVRRDLAGEMSLDVVFVSGGWQVLILGKLILVEM